MIRQKGENGGIAIAARCRGEEEAKNTMEMGCVHGGVEEGLLYSAADGDRHHFPATRDDDSHDDGRTSRRALTLRRRHRHFYHQRHRFQSSCNACLLLSLAFA